MIRGTVAEIGGLIGVLIVLAGVLTVLVLLLGALVLLERQLHRGWPARPIGFVDPSTLDRIHRSEQR